MERATWNMTEELRRWVKDEAERTGLAESDIVRRALDEYRRRLENERAVIHEGRR